MAMAHKSLHPLPRRPECCCPPEAAGAATGLRVGRLVPPSVNHLQKPFYCKSFPWRRLENFFKYLPLVMMVTMVTIQ